MHNDIDADYSPQYVKLARIIRAKIESGEYNRGDPVPAAGLAREHKISIHGLLLPSGMAPFRLLNACGSRAEFGQPPGRLQAHRIIDTAVDRDSAERLRRRRAATLGQVPGRLNSGVIVVIEHGDHPFPATTAAGGVPLTLRITWPHCSASDDPRPFPAISRYIAISGNAHGSSRPEHAAFGRR
jgi:hypothetical protein